MYRDQGLPSFCPIYFATVRQHKIEALLFRLKQKTPCQLKPDSHLYSSFCSTELHHTKLQEMSMSFENKVQFALEHSFIRDSSEQFQPHQSQELYAVVVPEQPDDEVDDYIDE